MDHLLGHVVRRGLDAHAAMKDKPDVEFPKIPAWGGILLIAITFLFAFLIVNVEYTFGHVIATLTMAESPTGIVFEPLGTDDLDVSLDSKDRKMDIVEPELMLVKQQPITAKLRTAAKHLHAEGGYRARFRGLFVYVLHSVLTGWTTTVLSFTYVPRPLAAIISAVVFARLRMAWTHVVIAETSPKPWFKRGLVAQGLQCKSFKANALATALLSVCEQATVGLPVLFYYAMKMDQYNNETISKMTCAEHKMLMLKIVSIFSLCLLSAVGLVIPAQVTLTRVQASMLTEEEGTIVPFDRSFGGRVLARSEGGNGIVGMLDAWRSFDWSARLRLIKLYIKVAILQFAVTMIYLIVSLGVLSIWISSEDVEKGAAMFNTVLGAPK